MLLFTEKCSHLRRSGERSTGWATTTDAKLDMHTSSLSKPLSHRP